MGGHNGKWSLFAKLFKLIVNDVLIVWLWIMNEFKKKTHQTCSSKVESSNRRSWKLDWINRTKYILYQINMKEFVSNEKGFSLDEV